MKMHLDEKIWLTLSFGMIMVFMLFTGYQAVALGMGPPSHKETIDPQKVDQRHHLMNQALNKLVKMNMRS